MQSKRFVAGAVVAAAALLVSGGIDETSLGQSSLRVDETDVANLKASVESFLTQVSQDNIAAGYRDLLKGGPLEDNDKQAALEAATAQLHERYGSHTGTEQVDLKTIGNGLVLLRYLYKCEQFPVVWYFTYYKPSPAQEHAWKLVTVRFDTQLEMLALVDDQSAN